MAESAVNFLLQRLVPVFENKVYLLTGVMKNSKFGLSRNMKARYRIAHELKNISSRMTTIFSIHKRLITKLDTSSEASNSIYTGKTWQDQRGDALLLDNTDLVSIDRPKQKMIGWLTKSCPGRKVISVTGMGGMGKTTLVS
ncbi:unnamed protein product [Vicia faba]|uniref:NB-ARC domain-containing protein n=1 Tax=Vicia faba TaxID=3906 RepID=A0AAV0YS37_VICFA|nr:unnamed protein product [Vicia faba]